jgi:hypothetical protein
MIFQINIKAESYPPELDWQYYRSRYNDLWSMNSIDLVNAHYNNYGINEGRISNRIHDKYDFAYLIKSSNVLEIGPFFNPMIIGAKYADFFTKDQMIERAKKIDIDPSRIPNINFNLSKVNLSEIGEVFDFAFSSHNIEHHPNLIKHLQDVSKVLRSKGCYFQVIPDKRYTFDHYLPETQAFEIVKAFEDKLSKHPFKKIFWHKFLTTHNDSILHWKGNHGDRRFKKYKLSELRDIYKESLRGYIDVHSWFFTPQSYRKIINFLYEKKYIDFKVEKIYSTRYGSCEFFAILKK